MSLRRRINGRTLLCLDGKAGNPVMYSPVHMGKVEAEPMWRAGTDRFIRHDVDVYLMTVPQRWEQKFDLNNFWEGDTISETPLHLEPAELDKGPEFVLERDPNAWVMIRFSPRPPTSWIERHPDQMVLMENEKRGFKRTTPSLASALFNEMSGRFCRAFVRYCESRPWAERCIGYVDYQLAEGTHGPLSGAMLYDFSPVMTERWRAWLTERYGSDAALRRAYGDDSLSLETVAVPRDRLRGPLPDAVALPYWQDARENRPLRDYLELMRELYRAQLLAHVAGAREGAGPDKLLLYDTFKLPMQGWSNHGFFSLETSWPILYAENLAGSGNMDVSVVLDMPEFDGLATPYDYQVRGAGGVFEPEGIADSVALRSDKLFFVEQDIRTYAGGVHNCGMMRNLQEFQAVTWRDLATALTRGFMNYMCDHNADYYSDAPMHEVVARQCEVLRESHAWPHETVPGVAMLLDERAVLETNGSGHVLNEAVMWEQKIGISRCGVPYRIYLLDDLKRDDFPEHAVYYFPNLYRVDDQRLALLREKVLRNGHVVVWGPGSGISDGETVDAAHAARLTGFSFSLQRVNYQRRVQICDFQHPVTEGLPADTIFGGASSYGPILYPTDGHALGWAWSKFGGDDVGLALKSFGRGAGTAQAGDPRGAGDYAAVFTTAVPLPAGLWRGLARFGGAHVYCEESDIVLADSSLVALHSLKSGLRTLRLPGPRRVTNLITGERLEGVHETVECRLNAPETVFFRLEHP